MIDESTANKHQSDQDEKQSTTDHLDGGSNGDQVDKFQENPTVEDPSNQQSQDFPSAIGDDEDEQTEAINDLNEIRVGDDLDEPDPEGNAMPDDSVPVVQEPISDSDNKRE